MNRRAYAGLFLGLLFLLIPVGFAAAQTAPGLVGSWKTKNSNPSIAMTLNADGTGKLDSARIKYTVNGNTLSVEEEGVVNKYRFELNGNTLTVSGGDLAQPMVFEREGAARPMGLGARSNQAKAPASPLAAAAAAAAPSGPAGTWEAKGPDGAIITLVLNADGSGTLNGEAGQWEFNHGMLILKGSSTTVMFNAALTATSMTLTNAALPQPLVFQRAGAEAQAPAEPAARSGNPLVGEWQGPRGLVQFNDDGTLRMSGENYRYTVQGNTLTMIAKDGSAPMRYQIEGDTLTLSSSTGTIALKRTGGAPAGNAAAKPGAGGVLPELAGQWCYYSDFRPNSGSGYSSSEACFTLKADGTYFYKGEFSTSATYTSGSTGNSTSGATSSNPSNSGRWTATATTITAYSSQGTQTFRLEKKNHPKTGDAQLCLDGQCYTTATQRPRWR